jgi:hypothetical protein
MGSSNRHECNTTASVVMPHNSRRAVGNGVATWSGTRQTVLLHWNTWCHAAHINRGTVFSIGSTPRLYRSTDAVSCEIGNSQQSHEAVNTEVEGSVALEAVTRQPVNP